MGETYAKPHYPKDKKNEPKWGLVLSNILLVLMVGGFLFWCFYPTEEGNNATEAEKPAVEKTTILKVRNSHPTDTVLVYLTLSGGKGFVSDVNGVFGKQRILVVEKRLGKSSHVARRRE